jgi:CRISPR-associated protein Csd1
MGWLTELNAVYDQVMKNSKDDKPLPLYHIANNAPLTVTLDGNGNFRSARLLGKGKEEKENWQTCMPCTEKSAARTSGVEAYPLCDKLEYVAGDYAEYAEGKNLDKKHGAYLSLLREWAQSEYSNQKIKSIYTYVKKGVLAADILKKGKIAEMNSPAGIAENNVFIRWEVLVPGDKRGETWGDPEIQRYWIAYYSKNCPNPRGFCYVTGKKSAVIGELHGQKIRNAADGAKLISSNDSSNYTFRGRFAEAGEACQIGMEVSVKAHSALRWLIKKQGATIGNGLTIVSWCSSSPIIPLRLGSSVELWPGDETDQEDLPYSSLENSARAIGNRLLGYYGKIHGSDKILIMGLNAATPGRMSLLLYREFTKSDFCSAQEHWHKNLAWFYSYWKEKRIVRTVSAPSPVEIVKAAYGAHAGDTVTASAIQRLLSCIIDRTPIPLNIERLCFERALRLKTLDAGEREKTLETACAVIKYNLYTQNGKEYKVGLEEDRKDRDYLFGRLLAVADRVESRALYSRNENRETNAVRYMQRFSKYPCSTWKLLYVDKLRPYFSQLNNKKSRDWYESLIQEIESLFEHDDFVSDEALSGEFLLGYHCQQRAFWDGIAKLKTAKQLEPTTNEEEDD